MDVEINETSLAAFFDELQDMEKEAAVLEGVGKAVGKYVRPGVLMERLGKFPASWGEGAKRFVEQLHPIKGLQRGWRWASPAKNPKLQAELKAGMLKEYGAAMPQRLKKTVLGAEKMKPVEMAPQEMAAAGLLPGKSKVLQHAEKMKGRVGEQAVPAVPSGQAGSMLQGPLEKGPGLWSRWFGTAGKEHLLRPEQAIRDIARGGGTAGEKVQAIAEQLSRSGWTGGGRLTKYVPVGSKGMIAGFGSAAVPGVVQAAKAGPIGPTGEGGAFERGLGLAGGTAGWVAGMPLGFLGSSGMWYGGERAGRGVGRIIDRLRGGAAPLTAVSAPTPTEAREQLETIARNYR